MDGLPLLPRAEMRERQRGHTISTLPPHIIAAAQPRHSRGRGNPEKSKARRYAYCPSCLLSPLCPCTFPPRGAIRIGVYAVP